MVKLQYYRKIKMIYKNSKQQIIKLQYCLNKLLKEAENRQIIILWKLKVIKRLIQIQLNYNIMEINKVINF